MIKLTVHRHSGDQTYLFTKECISIGEGESDTVDISLPGLGLHQNHIKITFKGNWFTVSNHANDPFITLNGQPFGKKKLKPLDAIKIKDCLITIDDIQVENNVEEPVEVATSLETVEEQICDFPNAEKLAKEDDLEGWFPSDLSDLNIEDIAKIEEQKQHKLEDSLTEENHEEKKSKTSLFTLKKLKWLAVFAILFLTILSAIGIETYLRAASKSGFEESKAAEGLADLAMALTYAKVFHVIPPNHNYSDPEFLKSNLAALLHQNSSLSCTIDNQGLFTNCSYLFRFYSAHGLSRFLIIAQPAPSLSQWLFPKDAILIDSTLMDVRKISDLKSINSLLAAPKPFEGSTERELTGEIKSLKVFSLPHLAKITKKRDFAPPKIIKYLRPGAENLIYNSPRYFLFTEPLLKKLAAYDLRHHSKENASALATELERFALFENLIIYTSEGLATANHANKVLQRIDHKSNFITAYLLLSLTDEILSSRLILDIKDQEMPKQTFDEKEIAEREPLNKPSPFTHPIDKTFEQFKGETTSALLPTLKQMAHVLQEGIKKNDYQLHNDFFLLLENYQNEKLKQKDKLTLLLKLLEKQYPEMPSLEIYRYLKQYQLENLIDSWGMTKQSLHFLNPSAFLQKKQHSQLLRYPTKIE